MDYWVWEAIEAVPPRVVVIGFQDILGPDRAVTVPYSSGFARADHAVNSGTNDYVGGSLAAMVKLGRRKGYRLVGANSMGLQRLLRTRRRGRGADAGGGAEGLPDPPVERLRGAGPLPAGGGDGVGGGLRVRSTSRRARS